jgi:hypothetical protein
MDTHSRPRSDLRDLWRLWGHKCPSCQNECQTHTVSKCPFYAEMTCVKCIMFCSNCEHWFLQCRYVHKVYHCMILCDCYDINVFWSQQLLYDLWLLFLNMIYVCYTNEKHTNIGPITWTKPLGSAISRYLLLNENVRAPFCISIRTVTIKLRINTWKDEEFFSFYY